MKKMTRRRLCVGMALAMTLALAACGNGGSSSGTTMVGIWEKTDYIGRTIEQGKLSAGANSTIVLFSDNTYALSLTRNTYYSSDGGETYNPTSYVGALAYGTYEITSDDAELGEKTMKFTTIDRVVAGEYDTDVAVTDAEKEIMTGNEIIGKEIYLTSDGRMSELIDITSSGLHKIGRPE